MQQLDQRTKNHTLQLSRCDLSADDLMIVIIYLNQHQDISSLDLSYNYLNADVTDKIVPLLAQIKTLTSLNLAASNISNSSIVALANSSTITDLDLYKVTDSSGDVSKEMNPEAVEALANDHALTSLDLSANAFISDPNVELAKSISL